ncbi:MAG TPA: MASE1 domain-containing protein [Leptolyngbyaceae cyanobacterium M33_DOE_097]|uniref:histidine kinase n=1 Tax=Oscillatoriales cyanobacterium SpSt-418 TaxID=2282169 RepID=A0A7C3KE62_9CYAN|nr:MASE1 domain-containing protein [Leptolyngbyaceae cyanobacterium M33_DOE_097]
MEGSPVATMGLSWSVHRENWLKVGAIAFACFGSAHLANLVLGLGLKATPVWFPAGIGLAALVLYGRNLWSGIALGIFSFSLSMGSSWSFAIVAALGSSISAFIAAFLLEQIEFEANLRRLRDVFGFVLVGGLITPTINATVNTLNTTLAGITPWNDFSAQWGTVWLGDSIGILVLAPVPLTWLGCTSCTQPAFKRIQADLAQLLPRLPEFLIWLTLLLFVSGTVFWASTQTELALYPLEYLPFPLIGWAALRLGQRGTVLGSLMVSSIAVLGLTRQVGPFLAKCAGQMLEAALLMQIFVGIISVTALVLAAAVAERQQVEDLLRVNQVHLQTLASSLECRVRERTAELHHRMQELHDSNQVKDLLLHAVAHDLKTPIQGMLMVLNKLHGKQEETVTVSHTTLERMIQSNEKLLYLLNSLLEDPTAIAAIAPTPSGSIQLKQIADDTVAKLAYLLQENQTTIVNQLSEKLPAIQADAIQIQQVFECLISNAIRHNAPGLTITLSGEVVETFVKQSSGDRVKRAILRCSVQDDGVGLPREQCDRLFELHSRNSHNCHLTGIGLGLYRSRQIILAHGGQIGVDSQPGKGADFWFTLPLSEQTV